MQRLLSLYTALRPEGLVELQRLEAINPVEVAIHMGIIDDDEDAKDALSCVLDKVTAFSVNG
jgi:hypothetical protein